MHRYWVNRLFPQFLFFIAAILSLVQQGYAVDLVPLGDRTSPKTETANLYLLEEESRSVFTPGENTFSLLARKMEYYRTIATNGGWPEIPGNILLKKGSKNRAVAVLRQRLAAAGDISKERNEDEVFDETLEQDVVSFQQCHGLKPDGVVGPLTLKELNVSAETRADQILVNMERLRRLSGSFGERYIYVNIADFKLDVIEKGRPVLTMKVVDGKRYWYTPVFSAKMTYLTINPSWNVPPSIASKELLPRLIKEPDYIAKQNFIIFKGWQDNTEVVDPAAIDWKKISAKAVPYRFQQQPGPLNPLGRIKFMFPNKFNINLHDTPAKGLFEKGARAFSHGCIRIEKPIELARYLLRDNPESKQIDIDKAIAEGKEQIVNLARSIDVNIVYLTAWPDDEGRIQFRDDIYGRDPKLLAELEGTNDFIRE